MNKLEETIGYQFRDRKLLELALTHSSYLNEHGMKRWECNERLEFLGDSILEFVSSEFLYETFPTEMEGSLSQMRANQVSEPGLAASAREIGLGEFLILGRGAEMGGSRNSDSVLADAFEALIAAVYLDGGIEPAAQFIRDHVLNDMDENLIGKDTKTALQELLQDLGAHATYQTIEESGPDHAKVYSVLCLIDRIPYTVGEGRSKKTAEKAAASKAIEKIRNEGLCI